MSSPSGLEREPRTGHEPASGIDLALAVLLAVAFGAWYFWLRQGQLWGDGFPLFGYATLPADELPGNWNHPLFVPLARGWLRLAGGLGEFEALSLLSPLAGGFTLAGIFWLARRLGAQRVGSSLACLLIGLAPGITFFFTLFEVHSVHAAGVTASALISCAAATRTRPSTFAFVHGLGSFWLFATHLSSPVLMPGWFVFGLVLYRDTLARASSDADLRAFVPFAAWFSAGMAIGAGAALAWIEFTFSPNEQFQGLRGALEVGAKIRPAWNAGYLHSDWLFPLAFGWLPVLLGLAAAWRGAHQARRSAGLALAFFLPSLAVFPNWGVVNFGGYLFGSLPFLAAVAAHAPRALHAPGLRLALSLGLALLCLPQAWLAIGHATDYRERFEAAERTRRVAAVKQALPGGGAVIGFDPLHQPLRIELPQVHDVDILRYMELQDRGAPEFADLMDWIFAISFDPEVGPWILDLSFREFTLPPGPLKQWRDEFERRIGERFRVVPLPESEWPLARLEPLP